MSSGHFHENHDGALVAVNNYKMPCVEMCIEKLGDDGYIHTVGWRRLDEVCIDLNRALESVGMRPDEYGMDLYPAVTERGKDMPCIPKHRWIACFAVEGGSEGHYIHVEAIDDDKRMPLFLGKTFQGMDCAYRIACACAKILGA